MKTIDVFGFLILVDGILKMVDVLFGYQNKKDVLNTKDHQSTVYSYCSWKILIEILTLLKITVVYVIL